MSEDRTIEEILVQLPTGPINLREDPGLPPPAWLADLRERDDLVDALKWERLDEHLASETRSEEQIKADLLATLGLDGVTVLNPADHRSSVPPLDWSF